MANKKRLEFEKTLFRSHLEMSSLPPGFTQDRECTIRGCPCKTIKNMRADIDQWIEDLVERRYPKKRKRLHLSALCQEPGCSKCEESRHKGKSSI